MKTANWFQKHCGADKLNESNPNKKTKLQLEDEQNRDFNMIQEFQDSLKGLKTETVPNANVKDRFKEATTKLKTFHKTHKVGCWGVNSMGEIEAEINELNSDLDAGKDINNLVTQLEENFKSYNEFVTTHYKTEPHKLLRMLSPSPEIDQKEDNKRSCCRRFFCCCC